MEELALDRREKGHFSQDQQRREGWMQVLIGV